jgi:hypothetical protein
MRVSPQSKHVCLRGPGRPRDRRTHRLGNDSLTRPQLVATRGDDPCHERDQVGQRRGEAVEADHGASASSGVVIFER